MEAPHDEVDTGDLLQVLAAQRNAALDQVVVLKAQVTKLQRDLAATKKNALDEISKNVKT